MIEFNPIGTIHSPFTKPKGMPIQPAGARGVQGTIELEDESLPALKDLDGFSHIILLYHFHQSQGFAPQVVPFLDSQSRGLFSTRAPRRPNAIGLSVVKLNQIEGNLLSIENVDILNGTPLLDIKPCVPDFDALSDVRTGWLEPLKDNVSKHEADERFK